jgi:hypothetical protein
MTCGTICAMRPQLLSFSLEKKVGIGFPADGVP